MMTQTDIAIVGGGLAGSMAAILLGRAGYDVHLVAPHEKHPAEFRCEKLEENHLRVLARNGLSAAVMAVGTRLEMIWIARYGLLIDKMPMQQYAMPYEKLVNAFHAQIPSRVTTTRSWVNRIETSPDRQFVTLANGQQIDARLVILACGLNWKLRESLGIKRQLVSACHSVTVGFYLHRTDDSDFTFPAMQYFPDHIGSKVAYLTLFRMDGRMRANLFLYTPLKSSLIESFRADPDSSLDEILPGLARLIGPYTVKGPIKVRPTDLHAFTDIEQPGVVLVGDAFATACPATGTGTAKVFNDVEVLCKTHIPVWLSSPGMDRAKISSFYQDNDKNDLDELSAVLAYKVRSLAIEKGWNWKFQRLLRFSNRLMRWSSRSTLQLIRTGAR